MSRTRWLESTIQQFGLFDPSGTQRIVLADRVGVLGHEELPGVRLFKAQKRILILHDLLEHRTIEGLRINLLHTLFVPLLRLHFDAVLHAVLIWLPPELLENASVALEDLSVDSRVLAGDLRIQVAVLHLDLHVVCNGKGSDLVRQIAKGLEVAHTKSVLHVVLLLVCVLVEHCNTVRLVGWTRKYLK